MAIMGIRNEDAAVLGPKELDSVPFAANRYGSAYVLMVDAAGAPLLTADGLKVQGNVASGVADAGNPVKVGGKYNATLPTLTDGQRGDLNLDSRAGLYVILKGASSTSVPTIGGGADSVAAATVALSTLAAGRMFNGSTYDMARSNAEAVLLASAARTATTNSPDQVNFNGKGCHVSIDVTVEGPATISLKIQGKHSIGGTYYDIVDFGVVYTAATDAPGAKTVSLYPGNITADHVGVGAGVNGTLAKSGVLPRTWRAVVTHADATTCTYSLSVVTLN